MLVWRITQLFPKSVKSRVRGDFHARFCERVRVKLPRFTRPCIATDLFAVLYKYIFPILMSDFIYTLQQHSPDYST